MKEGVDTLDKATGSYSCKRRTDRYPMSIVFNLIDLCCHNAFHKYKEVHGDFMPNNRSSKYHILDWLSKELALEYVKERSRNENITFETRAKISAFLNNLNEMYGPIQNPVAKCNICDGKKSLKKCAVCMNVTCDVHNHTVNVYQCPDCHDKVVNLEFTRSPLINKRCTSTA